MLDWEEQSPCPDGTIPRLYDMYFRASTATLAGNALKGFPTGAPFTAVNYLFLKSSPVFPLRTEMQHDDRLSSLNFIHQRSRNITPWQAEYGRRGSSIRTAQLTAGRPSTMSVLDEGKYNCIRLRPCRWLLASCRKCSFTFQVVSLSACVAIIYYRCPPLRQLPKQ